MAKMVIEIPDELRGAGEAMAAALETMKKTIARTGGGKSVDYARVERTISEKVGAIERESHRAILQSLDIDVPTIVIGGIRYNRVGRCDAPYHTMAGSISIERSFYCQSGQRGGQPGGRVVKPVSLRAGVVGNGWLPYVARVVAHEVQQGTSREAEASARELLVPSPHPRRFNEVVLGVMGRAMEFHEARTALED